MENILILFQTLPRYTILPLFSSVSPYFSDSFIIGIFPSILQEEWVICRAFKKVSGGNKVHISGLLSSVDSCLDLPPLTDLSSGEDTRHANAAEESHVTCFSKPKLDHQDKSLEECTSSSNAYFLYPDSVFGINRDMHPMYDAGLGPYDDDDQDFPNISSEQIDLDFLWNY